MLSLGRVCTTFGSAHSGDRGVHAIEAIRRGVGKHCRFSTTHSVFAHSVFKTLRVRKSKAVEDE